MMLTVERHSNRVFYFSLAGAKMSPLFKRNFSRGTRMSTLPHPGAWGHHGATSGARALPGSSRRPARGAGEMARLPASAASELKAGGVDSRPRWSTGVGRAFGTTGAGKSSYRKAQMGEVAGAARSHRAVVGQG